VCEYCHGDEDEECDKCGDYFTSCEVCGELNIPIDYDGMAGDICETCETPPAVVVGMLLLELLGDLEGMNLPDMSGNSKANYLEGLAEAVLLLRTHAVPPSHPWAVK
jgi:hypothetical protein